MRLRTLAAAILAAPTIPALAYDAAQAPRYGSPPFYRPDVDAIIVHGEGSKGPISGMSVKAPYPYGASLVVSDLLRRSTSIRDLAGIDCTGVADSSYPLSIATLAMAGSGRRIDVDGECRIRLGGAAQVWLKGVTIEGPGTREMDETGVYGRQGGTFLITDRTKSPFLMSNGWALRGLKFFWPDQTEAAAAANNGQPIAFPPLLAVHATAGAYDQVYSWWFQNNQVINAYDIADFSASPDSGHGVWSGNQQYALRYYMVMRRVGGEVWVTNNQYSFVAYYNHVIQGARNLMKFSTRNSAGFRIVGTGTPGGQYDLQSVDGLRVTDNYALQLRRFAHVIGGTLTLATFTNTGIDGTVTYLDVEQGGAVLSTQIIGGTAICNTAYDLTLVAPCISIDNGAALGNGLTVADVAIGETRGPAIVYREFTGYLRVSGGGIANVGNFAAGGPVPQNGIVFDAPYGELTVNGTHINTTAPANVLAKAAGVTVTQAKTSTITGNALGGWGTAVVINATTGAHTVTGNASWGSSGTAGIAGSGLAAGVVSRAGNNWDKGPADPVVAPFGAPASSGAPCQLGQVQVDASYTYTCTAPAAAVKWKRAPIGIDW